MRKCLIILILLTGKFYITQSQILVNVQVPYAGLYTKSQLWNLSVINNDGTTGVHVEISFADAGTGRVIFTGRSADYILTQPVTLLLAQHLSPITYTVIDNSYGIDINPDGLLPPGQFTVCYTVIPNVDHSIGINECTSVEIEPASPPVLINPADNEFSDIKRPFFNWAPPAPYFMFNNLTYDFKLVTVQSLQTPADAVQQNLPIFSQQNLAQNSLVYPASFPELDTAEIYAWQVKANSSNRPVSESEIFTFKVKEYTLDIPGKVYADYYVPLKRQNDAVFTIFDNEIKYEYINESSDTSATFNIYDISVPASQKINTESSIVKLKYGQNFIVFNISNNSGFVSKHMYVLELINSDQEKWYLKFEYRKPENQ